MKELQACDYIDPDGLIVKSGEMLARKVVEALRGDSPVRIQLKGLGSISSSYFNIILRIVSEELGTDALSRIEMAFVSPLQQQIYQRSLDALLHDSISGKR